MAKEQNNIKQLLLEALKGTNCFSLQASSVSVADVTNIDFERELFLAKQYVENESSSNSYYDDYYGCTNIFFNCDITKKNRHVLCAFTKVLLIYLVIIKTNMLNNMDDNCQEPNSESEVLLVTSTDDDLSQYIKNNIQKLYKSSAFYQYCTENADNFYRWKYTLLAIMYVFFLECAVTYSLATFTTVFATVTSELTCFTNFLFGLGVGISTSAIALILGIAIGLILLGIVAYKAYDLGKENDICVYQPKVQQENSSSASFNNSATIDTEEYSSNDSIVQLNQSSLFANNKINPCVKRQINDKDNKTETNISLTSSPQTSQNNFFSGSPIKANDDNKTEIDMLLTNSPQMKVSRSQNDVFDDSNSVVDFELDVSPIKANHNNKIETNMLLISSPQASQNNFLRESPIKLNSNRISQENIEDVFNCFNEEDTTSVFVKSTGCNNCDDVIDSKCNDVILNFDFFGSPIKATGNTISQEDITLSCVESATQKNSINSSFWEKRSEFNDSSDLQCTQQPTTPVKSQKISCVTFETPRALH